VEVTTELTLLPWPPYKGEDVHLCPGVLFAAWSSTLENMW
jgi:hypothetical protein